MSDMMKKMGKMGKGGMMKQAMKGMFGKGGPSQAEIEAAQQQMSGGKMPTGLGGVGDLGGFPGLGGGGSLPPGLTGFGKKK
jgi:signal recognition particle subunit SRP54